MEILKIGSTFGRVTGAMPQCGSKGAWFCPYGVSLFSYHIEIVCHCVERRMEGGNDRVVCLSLIHI